MVIGEQEKIMNLGGPIAFIVLATLVLLISVSLFKWWEYHNELYQYVNILIQNGETTIAYAIKALYNAVLFFVIALFAILILGGD